VAKYTLNVEAGDYFVILRGERWFNVVVPIYAEEYKPEEGEKEFFSRAYEGYIFQVLEVDGNPDDGYAILVKRIFPVPFDHGRFLMHLNDKKLSIVTEDFVNAALGVKVEKKEIKL
jgi:hypothetical protein